MVWLAVKPHAIGRVLREVTPVVRPDQLILSTAAGIPIKELEKVWTKKQRKLLCLAQISHTVYVFNFDRLLFVNKYKMTPVL